jgi:putative ABC transport system substrate-binding protein
LFDSAELIANLAAAHRVPSIGFLELAEAGGFLAYGVDFVDMHRTAAIFVDKILKGVRPDQLPVEQSTRFKLVINSKTAKMLGVTVTPVLLARADQVIE